MAVQDKAQLGMDERVLDDPELGKLLEERMRLGDDKREVTKVYKRADSDAKDKIATLGLTDGDVIRVGRFRITRRAPGESKHVAFDTDPKSRVSIELWGEE